VLISGAAAILNRGVTSLEYSVVSDSDIDFNGAIHKYWHVTRERGDTQCSGRKCACGESTIARNGSADRVVFYGSLTVKNSAIIFYRRDIAQPGGGILNVGSAEIINTTIAKNVVGFGGDGALFNSSGGRVTITDSTIRENIARFSSVFLEVLVYCERWNPTNPKHNSCRQYCCWWGGN
jgi:hypothetical protein